MKDYSRRSFLKTAGIAGGGLVMSTGLLRAQAQSSDKKLKIALVGIGAEGEVLLNSLLKIPNLEFVAVCDIWAYRLKYGYIRVVRELKQKPAQYENFEDITKNHKDLDAVVVATPDFWHAPQTVHFLKNGINVYCEKMMSNTVEGARSMVKAARDSGKLLQIGHQRKSNPRYIFAKEKLMDEAKLCGTILAANGQWNRAPGKDLTWPEKYAIPADTLKKYGYKDMQQFRNWRWYKGLGGGPISDLGSHQIDIFAWFFDSRPKTVMAAGGNEYYKKDWYDNVMCIYEYETKQNVTARVFYQVLTTTSSGGGYFESFMGTEGTIKMSENPSVAKVFKENNGPSWDSWVEKGYLKKENAASSVAQVDSRDTKPPEGYGLSDLGFTKPIHMPHLENFFDAVRGKCKLNCDAEHAFEAEAAVFKVNEAIEAKKQLEFTDDDFVA